MEDGPSGRPTIPSGGREGVVCHVFVHSYDNVFNTRFKIKVSVSVSSFWSC